MKIITVLLCAELSLFASALADAQKHSVVHHSDPGGPAGHAVSYSSFRSSVSGSESSALVLAPAAASHVQKHLHGFLGGDRANMSRTRAHSIRVASRTSGATYNDRKPEVESNKPVKATSVGRLLTNVSNNFNAKQVDVILIGTINATTPKKPDRYEVPSRETSAKNNSVKTANTSRIIGMVQTNRKKESLATPAEQQATGSEVKAVAVPQSDELGQEKVRTVVVQKRVPFPVKIPVPVYVRQPYPVPVYTKVPYPVKKRVPYIIEKHVHHHPVTVRTPVRHVVVPVAKPVPMPVTKFRQVRVPYPVYLEKKIPVFVHRDKDPVDDVKSSTMIPYSGVQETGLYHGAQSIRINSGSVGNLATYANGHGERYFPVKDVAKYVNFGKNKVAIFGSGNYNNPLGHTSFPSENFHHGLRGIGESLNNNDEVNVQKGRLSTVSTASVKLPDLGYIHHVGHELQYDIRDSAGYGYKVTDEHADASSGHIAVLESPPVLGAGDMRGLDAITSTPYDSSKVHVPTLRSPPLYSEPKVKQFDYNIKLPYSGNFQVIKHSQSQNAPAVKYDDERSKTLYAASTNNFNVLRPPPIHDVSQYKLFDSITNSQNGSNNHFPVIISQSLHPETDTEILDVAAQTLRHSIQQSGKGAFNPAVGKSQFDSMFGDLEFLPLNVEHIKPIGGYGSVGQSITFISPGLLSKT